MAAILLAVISLLLGVLVSGKSIVPRVPTCLTTCTANSTNPCNGNSLPNLLSCLNRECSSSNALTTYAVTYHPKIEYSCEQSMVPGHGETSANVTITGDGRCATSPYDFESFIAGAGTVSQMAGLCRMDIYPRADCQGEVRTVPLSNQFQECVFEGGRSARLDCSAAIDGSVALQLVEKMCYGNSTGLASATPPFVNSTVTATTTILGTGQPTILLNGTSIAGNGFITPTPGSFRGEANEHQGTNPSFAALVALVAMLTLL